MDKINEYLEKNFSEIEKLRSSGKIVWLDVAREIFQQTGQHIDKETLRNRFARLRVKKEVKGIKKEGFSSKSEKQFEFKENKTNGTAEINFTADHIPTEAEIIEWFKIDLAKYRINQIYHKTSFGGKYSVTISLLALKGAESGNYEEKFEKFVKQYKSDISKRNKYELPEGEKRNKKNVLYLCTLSDLHLGNYQKEGYVESIKERIFQTFNAIKESGVEKIILLNTGDMLHIDNSQGKTWKGTQLNAEESYEDIFTSGLDLITSLIEYSINLSLSVTYVNVRGNHSFDTEYCMGEALRRIFRNEKNVEIINSKDTRIYYKWKNNSFLFSHGDKGIERLPLLFATEGKHVFSDTEHHHIILGHLHHNKGKQFLSDRGEFAGIEVRVLGSPSSSDIWHKQEGLTQSKKSLISMLFTPEEGKYGEFNFKL